MKKFPAITSPALALTMILSLALGGCASTTMVPNDKLAVAEAAVERANSRSTSEKAPAELQIAIAKLESAKQALASHNNKLATQLLEQATLDAQVAVLRAETVRSQMAAKESQEASQVLRNEIERN